MTPEAAGGKVKCPDCKGEGVTHGFGCPGFIPITIPCLLCEGAKVVDAKVLEWKKIGEQMRQNRIERGKTLRVEAQERGLDAVVLSEMERGAREPVRRA